VGIRQSRLSGSRFQDKALSVNCLLGCFHLSEYFVFIEIICFQSVAKAVISDEYTSLRIH